MKKIPIVLLLFCFLYADLQVSAKPVDTDSRARFRSGVDSRVTELLVKSMQSRDAGDMNAAELFWMQAQSFKPALRRPAWLDEKPIFEVERQPLSEDDFLARVMLMAYTDARVLLAEKLQQDPGNIRIRRVFFELAEKNSDHAEVARHRNIVSDSTWARNDIYKYIAAAIMAILIFWQVVRLIHDLRVH